MSELIMDFMKNFAPSSTTVLDTGSACDASITPALLHDSNTLCTPTWRSAWASATGLRHAAQGAGCEDSCAALAPRQGGLHLALADGVSQGARGDMASRATVEHITHSPDWQTRHALGPGPAKTLEDWVAQADAVVQQALKSVTHQRGAATLACAWLGADGQGYISRVGDCRVYAWDAQPSTPAVTNTSALTGQTVRVNALTQDQSYTALGETPPPGVHPDHPARMVGVGGLGQAQIWAVQVPQGCGLVLCSDGLHDVLDEPAMAVAIAHHFSQPQPDLQALAQRLVRAAQDLGSDDDISVMLAQRL